MKVIGITGGIGAGKSEILAYLKSKEGCRVIEADKEARELEMRGGACYDQIVELLGPGILAQDGEIDRAKMAARIFEDKEKLRRVNEIVHPAVKEHITRVIAQERAAGKIRMLFIEAALLIEDGYEAVVDEMWYIYADEQTRRERLKASRGYTDEKIDGIMRQQMPEAEFFRYCGVVIDNGGTLADAYGQIDEKLGEVLCQRK